MASAKVFNREKVIARFAAMPAIIEATAAASLKGQVDQLVEALQCAAPVSVLEGHPGELRDSIHAYANADRLHSWRIIASAKDADGTYYGRYVEFGHTMKGGKFVHAQPFWFSTYRAWRKGMFAKIRADVRTAIKANFPQ